MALNINQYSVTTVQGQLDLQAPSTVITGRVDSAQATALVAGQPVKITTTAGGLPAFVAISSNSDKTFGYVSRNLKDASYAANSIFELATADSIIWLTANGAIARGSAVENVYTTAGLITASGGINPIIGVTLDVAVNNGDLVRVLLRTPIIVETAATAAVFTQSVTATLAQINAGLTLIPGVTNQKINVLNYTARVSGNFATGTAVILQSTNASPVLVSTIAEAGLTTGAVLLPSSANTTLGAGYSVPLGSGDGLQVVNSGSAQTGGTSITFTITYQQA